MFQAKRSRNGAQSRLSIASSEHAIPVASGESTHHDASKSHPTPASTPNFARAVAFDRAFSVQHISISRPHRRRGRTQLPVPANLESRHLSPPVGSYQTLEAREIPREHCVRAHRLSPQRMRKTPGASALSLASAQVRSCCKTGAFTCLGCYQR